MLRLLFAVDDTIVTRNAFAMFNSICSCMSPESITLCYVEKFQGKSMIIDMIGDAEMSALKESLEGTDHQMALDKRANEILKYYSDLLEQKGFPGVKQLIKTGVPAEEILKASKEVNADIIVIGSRGKGADLFMGSVSSEVVKNADIPVMIVK